MTNEELLKRIEAIEARLAKIEVYTTPMGVQSGKVYMTMGGIGSTVATTECALTELKRSPNVVAASLGNDTLTITASCVSS